MRQGERKARVVLGTGQHVELTEVRPTGMCDLLCFRLMVSCIALFGATVFR